MRTRASYLKDRPGEDGQEGTLLSKIHDQLKQSLKNAGPREKKARTICKITVLRF